MTIGGTASQAKLGFGMCVALVVGNMIGAGVFLLPASLAPLGWNSVLGWFVTIGGSLCIAFVLARLARDMAGGCGPFTYAEAAFGPATGFMIAWSYWVSVWVANGTLAVAAVSNLSVLFPGLATVPGAAVITAVVPIWLFTLINCLGVHHAGRVQSIATLLKLVPLAGAILIGAWLVLSDAALPAGMAPQPIAPVTPAGVATAATLTLFAMLGFESALAVGDRVKDPGRTVPRATLTGLAITGLIYLLACSAVTFLLPAGQVAASNAPFALFFSTLVNPALGPVIAVFAAIAALGALNGYVLVQGDPLLTMARRGMFPNWFARENRHATPQRAHILSSSLASAVVLANYTRGLADLFTFMVLVTTSVAIIFYVAGVLAGLKLEQSGRIGGSRGFRLIALVGLAYAIWTFHGAGLEAGMWSLAMAAMGLPVYLLTTRSRQARPQGPTRASDSCGSRRP